MIQCGMADSLALERSGDVFVLRFSEGENRFTPAFNSDLASALDEVEAAPGPKAVVTTGVGRFYSNGLDLGHMTDAGTDAGAYLGGVLALLARVLVLPAPTVAAVNGHAFGAGALLAVAQDFAIMRADRGWWCMPEIDMPAPLHPGMVALLQARLSRSAAHETIVTARRWDAASAALAGFVERAVPEADVLPAAIERAAALAPKAHLLMRTLKEALYAPVLRALALPLDAVGRPPAGP
jgi:enoyl-CoA hydratase/carnithine racemase